MPSRIWVCQHGGIWSAVDGGDQDIGYVRADVVESIKRKMIADSFMTVCECIKELGGDLGANMKGVLHAFEQMEVDARNAVKHSKEEMK